MLPIQGPFNRLGRPPRESAAKYYAVIVKGAGSRTNGLLIAFKLLEIAQRWRRLDSAILLPLVRAGAIFVDGVEKPARTTN